MQTNMLKIKISVYVLLASSLLTFACASNAAGGANVAETQKKVEKSNASTAEPEAIAAAAQKDAGAVKFKGQIGSAAFEMTLRRAGDDLSGSYFYVKSGSANALALAGKIDANGKFTLRETDAGGKQTGEFKGVWTNDANQPGATLEGEWAKPNAKETVFFRAAESMILLAGEARLTEKQIKETIKAKRIEVSAAYPELTGAAGAAGFNRAVKKHVDDSIAAFKKEMSEMTAEDLKSLPETASYSIDIGYTVEYADTDLISVGFLNGTYEGGAHPNSNSFTINYDLKNNREIKLADVFKPGAKYLDAVSAYSIKDLQSRKDAETGENMGIAQEMWADGATPEAGNYASWNVTKKGLMFTFDAYQVAPYAAGPQTVIVPYANLKAIAKPDGALAKFIK